MLLFVVLVAIPIVEIALFIQVGGAIGLWPTLGIVVATAFIGTFLIRAQGAAAMERLRAALSSGQDPSGALADGAAILMAGALLLTPGFFTDALGLALLFAPTRFLIFRAIRAQVKVAGFAHTTRSPDVVEGEFVEIDPETPPQQPRNTNDD
ncbi:MAG: FxsA family protein [Paracoccaceae bacterium]